MHYTVEDKVVKAVDGVDLSIGKCETLALVGESGCGKSTTAFSILRLLPSNAKYDGEIIFDGQDLLKIKQRALRKVRRSDISMVFQSPATYLNPVTKVGKQIAEALKKSMIGKKGGKLSKKKIKEKVISTLRQVGIASPESVYDYYPHQMSGGMKQRAVIAMALISEPSLLIADEPTTNLDVTVQAQVLLLMKELIENTDKSTLIITHDLGIVADLADRVYIMYAGRTVECADVFSIYENPKHPYTKALLKCTLSVDEYCDSLLCIRGMVPDLINPPTGCLFHPRCDYALPKCSQEYPPKIEVEPNHSVRCWLYEK